MRTSTGREHLYNDNAMLLRDRSREWSYEMTMWQWSFFFFHFFKDFSLLESFCGNLHGAFLHFRLWRCQEARQFVLYWRRSWQPRRFVRCVTILLFADLSPKVLHGRGLSGEWGLLSHTGRSGVSSVVSHDQSWSVIPSPSVEVQTKIKFHESNQCFQYF